MQRIRFPLHLVVLPILCGVDPPTDDRQERTVVGRTADRFIPAAEECKSPDPAWIWCDDFEVDRLDSYFEYSSAGGSFVRTEGTGVAGSRGMRARFRVGQENAGNLHLAFGRTPDSYFVPVDGGTTDYREVYWRIYLKNEPGWVGGSGHKLSRATVFAESSWSQAMIGHVWGGSGDHLVIDPVRGTDEAGNLLTTGYNDFSNFTWLGSVGSGRPIFGPSEVGRWHCIEAHLTLNHPDRANGIFRLWIDDHLEAERTDYDFLGGFADYGINAVFIENYWNGGSPAAQDRFLDRLVVSTDRIGC